MKARKHPPLNGQIYAEASDWLVEFRAGDIDATGRKEFYAWLRTSPEHMRAYLELAAIWNEGPNLGQGVFDDAALMQEVRAEANVVPWGFSRTTPADSRHSVEARSVRSRAGIRWAAAACVVALLLSGAWFYRQRDVYATGIGEQRTLALADGSRIELNAHSRVRIRFSQHERDVDLLDGQVMFQVAKDPSRAFVVHSNAAQVIAVGTQFDVYSKSSQTTVTVVEGRVAVTPAVATVSLPLPTEPSAADTTSESSAPSQSSAPELPRLSSEINAPRFFLAAGEQAVITAQAAVKDAHANVSAATAWTEGRLVFQGTSLQQVAEEFNRYNTRRLVIRDPKLANFKITGIFSSTDPSSLIRFLEARPGIAVVQKGNEISVSRKF
jgi:transmembrane sensor